MIKTRKQMLIEKMEVIISYYRKEQKENPNKNYTEDLIREIEHLKEQAESLYNG